MQKCKVHKTHKSSVFFLKYSIFNVRISACNFSASCKCFALKPVIPSAVPAVISAFAYRAHFVPPVRISASWKCFLSGKCLTLRLLSRLPFGLPSHIQARSPSARLCLTHFRTAAPEHSAPFFCYNFNRWLIDYYMYIIHILSKKLTINLK